MVVMVVGITSEETPSQQKQSHLPFGLGLGLLGYLCIRRYLFVRGRRIKLNWRVLWGTENQDFTESSEVAVAILFSLQFSITA